MAVNWQYVHKHLRLALSGVLIGSLGIVLTLVGVPSAYAAPNPVAAYSFDEGSGAIAGDSAGNHDGAIAGASWASSGKYGSALDFDGVNDFVSIADANDLDLTNSFTLEAWVRPDSLAVPRPVIAKGDSVGGETGYIMSAKFLGGPSGVVAKSGTSAYAVDLTALPTGAWSHLAFTSDGTNLRLYINGTLVKTKAAIAAGVTAADLFIGHHQTFNSYFDGLIDEVRIYGQPLSESQIQVDRDAAVGLDQIPAAAYSFDEASGTVVNDLAGDNTGTISGATWASSGKYGSALDFDGVNDFVSIADANDLDLTNSFTLEAWVRPDSLAVPRPVIAKGDSVGGETGYIMSAKFLGGPSGVVAKSGTSAYAVDLTALPTGAWSHLAFTSDGTNLRLYINGTLVKTKAAIAAGVTAADLFIGHHQTFNSYFDGLIDEVRIYDQILSQTEIAADLNTEIGIGTTITSPTPTYTSGTIPSISFTSNKDGSTFKCSIDGPTTPTTPCTSPYQPSVDPGAGWHTFRVTATDSDGNTDSTPATYMFNLAIYPRAPLTSKLVSPEGGRKTSSHYTLKAKWATDPSAGEVTGLTFQWKLQSWKEFRTIPGQYVSDTEGQEVSWPLSIAETPGESEPVFFDARSVGSAGQRIKFRAVFDGDKNGAGATTSVSTEYDNKWGSPTDTVTDVGPVTLNLLTGGFTINRTDVSIPIPGSETALEFTRTFYSKYDGTTVNNDTMALGGTWQPSEPVEQSEGDGWRTVVLKHEDAIPAKYETECEEGECFDFLVEDEIPAADWAEVYDNHGSALPFELVNESYVPPAYARQLVLLKQEGNFVLAEPDGTRTVFAQSPYSSNQYDMSAVSWQHTPGSARTVYQQVEGTGSQRLAMIIAPSAAGVKCEVSPSSQDYALSEPGCRTLVFNYFPCSCAGGYRLLSITYHNASTQNDAVVAQYAYNPNYNLSQVWDPRISQNLKEEYAYASNAWDIASLTPPGEEPWHFSYYPGESPGEDPKGGADELLKSVSRASLLTSPAVAQTTIVYDVPVSGAGAPYDMSPSTVAEWGQEDFPVNATAVFPPDQVPAEPPSSYSRATIFYMDPDGYLVNTASAAKPGATGPTIETMETNRSGSTVRSLSPQNRLFALAAGANSVARSHELDTHRVFSADGTEMLQEWRPLHEVRLESGSTVQARRHKTIEYDQGASDPPTGTAKPHLPTKVTIAASIPGQSDADLRVTETKYDWNLREPIETIVDPTGLNLRTKSVYESGTGLPIESRSPGNPEGGTAGTTKTVYYTAGAHPNTSSCGNKPEWANLPCRVIGAAAPSPSGGNPERPWTRFDAYSSLDQPTELHHVTGGSLQRLTLITYDSAGRLIKRKVSGGGTSIPTIETVYSPTTGRPLIQQFVCEDPENCSGFDSQAVTSTYNTIGQLTSYQDADGGLSTITYDLRGRPVTTTDGKGTQAVTYDASSGLPIQVSDSAGGNFTASYDANGNLIGRGLPNGLTAQTTYDETGAATHMRYEKTTNCTTNCIWLDFELERSIHRQVLWQTSTLSTQEYSYDKAGRLLLTKDTPQGGSCTTRTYTYDANSNRTKLVTRTPGIGGVCDTTSSGTTKNYSYDTGDRLIGEGITYDNLGRITSLAGAYSGGGNLTTTYYANNFVRSQTQDGLTNTYDLDSALRQRSSTQSGAKTGTSIYHYAGGIDSPSWIDRGSGWSRNIIGIDGGLVAIQDSVAGTKLQLTNLHGDIVATASIDPYATGPLSTFQSDEFGNPNQANTPTYGWLGVLGRRTELPSGVIQMGVRSYVPAIGRFTSPDPIAGASANAYDYGAGDPVNRFDFTGESPTAADTDGKCTGNLHVYSPKVSGAYGPIYGKFYARFRIRCSGWSFMFTAQKAITSLSWMNHGTIRHWEGQPNNREQGPSLARWGNWSGGPAFKWDCLLGQEYQFSIVFLIHYATASRFLPIVGGVFFEPGDETVSMTAREYCGHGKY